MPSINSKYYCDLKGCSNEIKPGDGVAMTTTSGPIAIICKPLDQHDNEQPKAENLS